MFEVEEPLMRRTAGSTRLDLNMESLLGLDVLLIIVWQEVFEGPLNA